MPEAALPGVLPRIAAVTTCKGRLANLQLTLPTLLAQPFAEVVVVDYDCPEHSGDWVEATYPQVRVVRVSDAPVFSCARARNLGAADVTAPWILFIDVDVRVAANFLAEAAPLLVPGTYVHAFPLGRNTWGTIFVARADYGAVGGYDEVFRGWGGEDDDLRWSLDNLGRRYDAFPAALFDAIQHSDELRTRYLDETDRLVSGRRNAIYGRVKQAVVRQQGPLNLAARQALYDAVAKAVGDGKTLQSLNLPLPRHSVYGVHLDTTLHFDLSSYDYERQEPPPP